MDDATTLGNVGDRLRVSIDHLMEGVQVIGRDWIYQYLNEPAARHGQRRVEDLLGRSMTACYPGIEDTPLFALLRRVMETRQSGSVRNEFVFPSGEHRWFDLLVEPVPDGICVVSLDVTDRHVLEGELNENRERTLFALRAARMGVWEMHLPSGRIEWSEAMAEAVGVPGARGPETEGGFLALVDSQDRGRVRAAIDRVRRGDATEFAVEFRLAGPAGKARWMQSRGSVVPDAAGRPERIVGVGIDITERRNIELQLQQAQKMEAIGRLAGGIAHDFNNQLTAILGFCDLALADLDPDSRTAHDIHEIKSASRRAHSLTRQLLMFTRRQALTIEPIDLNRLVYNLERLLTQLLGGGITVELRLDPSVAFIQGDVGHLENVLTNLAVNARDAMPHGGRVTVSTASAEFSEADTQQYGAMTAGRYTSLSVADTGLGMDDATKARLFEPFFTTKGAGKGTGLGLSTVYGIVKQMDGFIWVYSELGRGSTFRMYFPETAETPRPRTAEPEPPAPAAHATVLVVENDHAVRTFAVRALSAHGYQVLSAQSAEEALTTIEAHAAPIDLLVVDVVLPGRSGPQLLESLHRSTGVLYVTGHSESQLKDSGDATGWHLLEKPFTIHELLRKAGEALAASR